MSSTFKEDLTVVLMRFWIEKPCSHATELTGSTIPILASLDKLHVGSLLEYLHCGTRSSSESSVGEDEEQFKEHKRLDPQFLEVKETGLFTPRSWQIFPHTCTWRDMWLQQMCACA